MFIYNCFQLFSIKYNCHNSRSYVFLFVYPSSCLVKVGGCSISVKGQIETKYFRLCIPMFLVPTLLPLQCKNHLCQMPCRVLKYKLYNNACHKNFFWSKKRFHKFCRGHGTCTPLLTQRYLSLCRSVQLNGQTLKMVDDQTLPALSEKALRPGSALGLPPFSYGFFVIRNAKVAACI